MTTSQMVRFFITFAQCDRFRRDAYTVIEATDLDAAHDEAYSLYGNRWSMCYRTAHDAGVDRFNLKYIPPGA